MRSLWKIKYVKNVFYKTKKKAISILKRDSNIIAPWVGKNISIYNGNTFKKILVDRKHVGFKVGEFAFTRKYTKKASKSDSKNNKGSKKS